jgi:hypothetical protein
MPSDDILICLSRENWRQVLQAIQGYQDSGPLEEGWKSDELSEAESALEQELKKFGIT